MTAYADPYEKFAKAYDLFRDIADIDQNEETFYQRLFSQHKVVTVLDCACGTGKHCYLFSKMGYKVQASDISESMLSQARENFLRLGVDVSLTRCDFRELEKHFDDQFDAVVCLSTSLPHLHKDKELIRALTSMRGVLKSGGIVVIDQGTTHSSIEPDRRFELIVNNRDISRMFVKDVKENMQTIHIIDIYHSDLANCLEHYSVVYRILLDDDYRRLMKSAGYKNIRIFGGHDMSAYDPDTSQRLIAVAEA
jgi:ubiquinone/menaquinone biosynthesis C-methylase UbiE